MMKDKRLKWSDFKTQANNRNALIQETPLYGIDGVTIKTYLLNMTDGDLAYKCYVHADGDMSDELTDYADNYQSKSNRKLDNKTPDSNIPKVAIYKAQGDSEIKVSHDFTDKTTWYQESVKVMNEVLVVESGKIYTSSKTYWIDGNHGKIYMEDDITSDGTPMVYGGVPKYLAIIKNNGSDLVMGQDYEIDYVTGKVTLDASYTPSGDVTATFYYATTSMFTVIPEMGKMLNLQKSELQFTDDLVMNTPVNFDIYVYNPMDLPNKILYKRTKYKNIKDIINAANLGQGYIPAVDVMTRPVLVFPFDYATEKTLRSSQGAELRISLVNDVPFTGEWGTVTLYVMSEDE